MWMLRWGVQSNERSVSNARAAATECSRRRLERTEVDLYLRSMVTTATVHVAAEEPRQARAH